MKTFSKSSHNPQLPSDTVNQRLVNSGQGRDTNPLNRGQGWLCTQKGRTRVIRGWSVRHSCGKHGRKLGGVTDIKGLDAGGHVSCSSPWRTLSRKGGHRQKEHVRPMAVKHNIQGGGSAHLDIDLQFRRQLHEAQNMFVQIRSD